MAAKDSDEKRWKVEEHAVREKEVKDILLKLDFIRKERYLKWLTERKAIQINGRNKSTPTF